MLGHPTSLVITQREGSDKLRLIPPLGSVLLLFFLFLATAKAPPIDGSKMIGVMSPVPCDCVVARPGFRLTNSFSM